jgi:hypothetical protein
MKKTLRVLVLVMLLAGSVYAGDMPNGITGEMPNGVASTPPSTNVIQEPVGESQSLQTTESPGTEIVLNLLQSVLALF